MKNYLKIHYFGIFLFLFLFLLVTPTRAATDPGTCTWNVGPPLTATSKCATGYSPSEEGNPLAPTCVCKPNGSANTLPSPLVNTPTEAIAYPPPPCAVTPATGSNGGSAQGGCSSVNTAFGTWSTDPNQFVKSMMGILMSIAGGIAVLLIIAAGYSMIMSQGDPEKLQAAKERLTAAIIGLLFLIFSVVILEIIGVDILQLPDWKDGSSNTTNTNTTTANASTDNAALDATACNALQAGSDPQCGLDGNGSGLFCGAAGSATNCHIGGRVGVLYRCTKNANGTFTSQVAQICPNSDCQQINGAANADACGKGQIQHYGCNSGHACVPQANGPYTTGNCNNSCL